ncbi:MAG TPA: hypothetical protein VFT95_04085 [Micromonosporaceae bacterium]|nr:hypothetical protein [Micromonosporaceae bacterium]
MNNGGPVGVFGELVRAFFGEPAQPKWYQRARRAVLRTSATAVHVAGAALAVWACVVAAVHLGRTL